MNSLYAGRSAVIATMHGKERVISPPFSSRLGFRTVLPSLFDTDLLGTFTGEIPRYGTMENAAIAKARAGMKLAHVPFGIASEGSYGPHPQIPFVAAGIELMVFVDEERHIVITETLIDEAPVFAHVVTGRADDISDFLNQVDFPNQGVIASPNRPTSAQPTFFKGLLTREALTSAISASCASSQDGCALLQTDMRAHMNPARMKSLETLAVRLVERIENQCPLCASPGFGLVGAEKGLPCEYCGGASVLVHREIRGCVSCTHREWRPRTDRLTYAEQIYCTLCNP